jgi:hypothetical protein
MRINGTIKKIAASTAIAGSLGLGVLGLACGVAAAAPAEHAGAGSSTNSGHHAHSASKPPTSGRPEVDAHLIPGFTPKPAAATSTLGLGDFPDDDDPDSPLNCHEPRCEEIIHE